jgi:hypothetical protein
VSTNESWWIEDTNTGMAKQRSRQLGVVMDKYISVHAKALGVRGSIEDANGKEDTGTRSLAAGRSRVVAVVITRTATDIGLNVLTATPTHPHTPTHRHTLSHSHTHPHILTHTHHRTLIHTHSKKERKKRKKRERGGESKNQG